MRTFLPALCTAVLAATAQDVHPERLRADVAFLAAEPLAGRRALEPGSDVAAHFIAAEFRKAGLQPGAGDSFFQPFELIEYRMDSEATRLVVHRGSERRVLAHGRDFGGSFPRHCSLRAPVVFAGYGIVAPEYDYDDYAGLDVRGKIVLAFEYEPRAHDATSPFNGTGNTVHASPRRKLLVAQERGAVALLLIPAPNRKRPFRPGRGGRVQALAESEIRIPMFTLTPEAAGALIAHTGRRLADLQQELDRSLKPLRLPLEAEVEIRAGPAGGGPGRDPNTAAGHPRPPTHQRARA
ncbi:MAG: PA domain-containing protein, partial [Bryobacterales bacterium]|nr:PA domain-containing protein [Bryobacterales bacterium]